MADGRTNGQDVVVCACSESPPLASTRWHNKNSNKFNATQQALGMTLGHVTASERGRGTYQGASLGVALLPLFVSVVCVQQLCARVCVAKLKPLTFVCASMHYSYAAWPGRM